MAALERLRWLTRRHGAFVALCSAVLGVFQFLIAAAVSAVDLSGAFEALIQGLPPMMRMMLETTLAGSLSGRGLIAFGWNHPISQAAGAAVAIVLASRAVAGEAEEGTIEIELAQPLGRLAFLGATVAFSLLALAAAAAAGLCGTLAGERLFDLERSSAGTLLALGWNYLALQWAWFGVTLALSAGGREAGRVASGAFLLALASYVAVVIGRLWESARFVQPWSLYDYFAAHSILAGDGLEPRTSLVLVGVLAAALGVAAWRFARRDLP